MEMTEKELKNFVMNLLKKGYPLWMSLIITDADDDTEKTVKECTISVDEEYVHAKDILYLLNRNFEYNAPEFYIKIVLKDEEVKKDE